MAAWTPEELARISASEELEITSEGGKPVPVWVVRCGDSLLVRSSHGPQSGWFKRATTRRTQISAGGITTNVDLRPTAIASPEVDAAYHAKYDVIGAAWIAGLVAPLAASTTRELLPDE